MTDQGEAFLLILSFHDSSEEWSHHAQHRTPLGDQQSECQDIDGAAPCKRGFSRALSSLRLGQKSSRGHSPDGWVPARGLSKEIVSVAIWLVSHGQTIVSCARSRIRTQQPDPTWSWGHRRSKAVANHFATQFCWFGATMMFENLCLDCAHRTIRF